MTFLDPVRKHRATARNEGSCSGIDERARAMTPAAVLEAIPVPPNLQPIGRLALPNYYFSEFPLPRQLPSLNTNHRHCHYPPSLVL